MENIAIIIGSISAIIAGFFKIPFKEISNIFGKNKKVNYSEIMKHIEFLDNHDKSYGSEILLEFYRKNIFKDLTGIEVSSKKHLQILKISHEFENEYNGYFMKKAFKFMRFNEDNSVELKISKIDYVLNYFLLFAILYLLFASVFFFILFSYSNFILEDFIYLLFSILLYILCLTFLKNAITFFKIVRFKKKLSIFSNK